MPNISTKSEPYPFLDLHKSTYLRRYRPFLFPTFWSWQQNPRAERWTFQLLLFHQPSHRNSRKPMTKERVRWFSWSAGANVRSDAEYVVWSRRGRRQRTLLGRCSQNRTARIRMLGWRIQVYNGRQWSDHPAHDISGRLHPPSSATGWRSKSFGILYAPAAYHCYQ
jgi:hypothetical protein